MGTYYIPTGMDVSIAERIQDVGTGEEKSN